MDEVFDPALEALVNPPVALPELSPVDLAALAREIAMDIKDVDIVLGFYHITPDQYAHLKEHNEFFKQAL